MVHPRRTAAKPPDPREAPAYQLAEAARYLRLAPATLRAWVVGRDYPTERGIRFFPPLIGLPNTSKLILSFSNLVEAHVLRALRTEHAVSIKAVRQAQAYAERAFELDHLLLRPELKVAAGELFLDRYSSLISLSKSGQLAMRTLLDTYLDRIERDVRNVPLRLFPFVRPGFPDDRRIAINPNVAFGRPVIARKAISTAVIADRIDAGESVEDLASDYGLVAREIEDAVLYERAA